MPRALQPGMEQRSVLVVDDDLAMREMLVSLFREHGYRAEGTQILASGLVIGPDGAHSLSSADPVFVVHATPARTS